MNLPAVRSLRLLVFIIALLLVGLAFYPGTLVSPYEPQSYQYEHAVAPESTENFEQYTADVDPPVREYDDLSPAGQTLFDRARAEPAGTYSGWHRYTPTVCRPAMVVCDGVHANELPPEFTYGENLEPAESLSIIVDGDAQRSSDSRTQSGDGEDRYLLRTGDMSHADSLFAFDEIVSVVTLVPLGLFFAAVAVTPTLSPRGHRVAALAVGGGIGLVVISAVTVPPLVLLGVSVGSLAGAAVVPKSKRTLAGLSLVGGAVAVLGVLTPYIGMFTPLSVEAIGLSLGIAIWLGFAVAAGYTIYLVGAENTATNSE